MKITLLIAAAVLVSAALSAPVRAADATDHKSRFYDMGAQHIDGTVRRPVALAVEAHTRPKWARLFALKKSLRAALHATAAERSLK
ncbi:MAG: hypothetical protein FJ100_13735 [Deltaproteobacteria bacterium]|nr:hypothetical protein [Deltaproteobacteria bacterium]